jgi:hypothetical protein
MSEGNQRLIFLLLAWVLEQALSRGLEVGVRWCFFGLGWMRCSLWSKMGATRAVRGQEDVAVVRVLLEYLARSRK